MKRRPSLALLALLVALAGLTSGVGLRASLALFIDQETDQSTLSSGQVFSGERTTPAFSVRDASDGGATTDESSTHAFDDGLRRSTNAWSSSFSGTRYLEFDFNSPLPAGLTVSSASFNFKFASLGAGTGCYYFETRVASTGSLLATYGSSGSPVGCVTGTTQTSFSTSILSSVTTTDIANDLRIRVYGNESGSVGWSVELGTVSGSTSAASFTLYRTQLVDQATGSPTTDVWGPAVNADGYAYTTRAAWGTGFGGSRYVEFRMPAYVPSGSTISAAEFRHAYRPASGGASTPAYVNHTAVSSSSNATNVTINVPAGISNGHLLLTAISIGGNAAFVAPSGWTQIYVNQNSGGSVGVWYRVASSEPASYNWSWGGGNSRRYSGYTVGYSGVDTTTPIDASGGQSVGGSATPITAPSISPTSTGTLLLFIAGAGNGVTYTQDAAMSERLDLWGSSGGSGSSVTLAEQQLSASGPTGTRTATASDNPNRYSAVHVALRPATITPNACYYFEVYEGTTLRGTHGSIGSPVSCNTSTSTYQADVVSLGEVNSVACANDLRIRLYFKDAAAGKTLHDRVLVAITYSTP